jgi:hypothetical protein
LLTASDATSHVDRVVPLAQLVRDIVNVRYRLGNVGNDLTYSW